MKINRRELGALVVVAASVGKAMAQTPASTQVAAARDFLAEARLQHAEDAAAMAKVELPQSTEPAFEFRP
jgi:hypothetical protein